MNKNIEKEYKVLVTKDQFEALRCLYKNLEFIRQINTYYDTDSMAIKEKQGAMRIRTLKDTCIFTLKLNIGHKLYEYETFVKDDTLEALQQSDIKALLNEFHIQGDLKRLTQLVTERAIIETDYAEICFDISTYQGKTDYEIEYEYKKDHDGLTAFQTFLKPIGISYKTNCISKIQRALRAL